MSTWRDKVGYVAATTAASEALELAGAAAPPLTTKQWRVLAVLVRRLTCQRSTAGELSSGYLATLSGLDRRDVLRALDRLEHAGVIVRDRSRGRFASTVAFPMKQWVSPPTVDAQATVGATAHSSPEMAERQQWAPPPTVEPPNSGRHRPQLEPATVGASAHTKKEVRTREVEHTRAVSAETAQENFDKPEPAETGNRNRRADPLWDALAAELNHEPGTGPERGKWNAALGQLRRAGATADDIHQRCHRYRREHPTWVLTPNALVAHWGSLGPPLRRSRPTTPRPASDDRPLTRSEHDQQAAEAERVLEHLRRATPERPT